MKTGAELTAVGIIVLLGEEGKDWEYYGCDGWEWWAIRLWIRRN